MPTSKVSFYFHIPFCRSKCPYCDFYSSRSPEKIESYTRAVEDEIITLNRLSPFVTDSLHTEVFDTVYFGGGTPSVLGADNLTAILDTTRRNFIIDNNAEITAEVNPSVNNPDLFFAALKNAGFNRISMGLQSAVDSERRILGRTADSDTVKQCVMSAKKAGFTNISLDIMLGIPNQTIPSLEYTIDFALALGATHLSCYMLQLEEGTWFYKNKKKLNLPDDDTVADMYLFMCDSLKSHGMRHYEISNFCFDNHLSRHNMKYWTLSPYIGIGPSAHSFYNGRRFFFGRDTDGFISGTPAEFDCFGGGLDEKIMLALRTDLGLEEKYIPDIKKLTPFFENKLIERRNNRIFLTDNGFLLSNSIIANIMQNAECRIKENVEAF